MEARIEIPSDAGELDRDEHCRSSEKVGSWESMGERPHRGVLPNCCIGNGSLSWEERNEEGILEHDGKSTIGLNMQK